MALFNRKKSQDATAPAAAPTTQDDFSDFSPEALTSAAGDENGEQLSGKRAGRLDRKTSTGSTIKPGTAIGLNIGNDSIKVVEATAKGSEITITALGMVPTPEDSISNGLVTNPAALAAGIRSVLAQAGIRSKKTVSSVAGAGGTVVRVFEVKKMSDEELLENMKIEADRYIPFPPSEVQMDFKALRELPSDPDSENMEVLLAASKRDVIDSHVKVVQSAKLDPRAIDVEPLSAARALTHPLTSAQTGEPSNGALPNTVPDYDDVSAVLNIGAGETEISILRGDLLVFTRTIPTAGNTFTQEISERLHLDWHDAEQLKREKGDALAPVVEPGEQGALDSTGQSEEDWSDFSEELFEDTPQTEPGEQHQQKESDETDEEESDSGLQDFFDFGDESEPQEKIPTAPQETFDYLSLFGEEEDEDEADLPTLTDDAASEAALPSAFDFPDEDEAPLEFGTDQLPARREKPAAATAPAEADIDPFTAEDAALLPSEARPDTEAEVEAPTGAPVAGESTSEKSATSEKPAPAIDFDFGIEEEEPSSAAVESDPLAEFMASTDDATEAAQVDLSAIPSVTDTEETSAETSAPEKTGLGADLDDLFSDDAPIIESEATTAPAGEADLLAPAAGAIDFGADLGDDLAGFGAGLSGVSAEDVTPSMLNEIVEPTLDGLIAEVRRSLEFYTSHRPGSSIERIILVGGGAKLKNIDVYFTQKLGIPTTVGNPALQLKQAVSSLPANYIEENGTIYTVALGLAMRELTQ